MNDLFSTPTDNLSSKQVPTTLAPESEELAEVNSESDLEAENNQAENEVEEISEPKIIAPEPNFIRKTYNYFCSFFTRKNSEPENEHDSNEGYEPELEDEEQLSSANEGDISGEWTNKIKIQNITITTDDKGNKYRILNFR